MLTLKGHRGRIRALDFSPRGERLVSCGGRGSSVSLWQLPAGKRTYLSGHAYPVFRLAFGASEGVLLSSEEIMSSRLWTQDSGGWSSQRLDSSHAAFLQQGTEVVQLKLGYRQIHGLYHSPLSRPNEGTPTPSFHVQGQILLAGSPSTRDVAFTQTYTTRNTRQVRLSLSNPTLSKPREIGTLRSIPYSLRFRPMGDVVAVGTTTELARYEVASGAALPLLRGHTRMVSGLAYLPDGRLLSCSTDGTVRTWDHESGKCLDTRDWQMGPLTAITVARDGMRAAVGSEAGEILIWDVD